MRTGDTAPKILYLLDTGGNPQTYASAAAFTGAGWALTWYAETGAALASQPVYTVTALAGGLGQHVVSYTVPAGAWEAVPTVPGGMSDPGAWGGEGSTYDEDSIAGLIATSQGTPGVQSAADSNLGDVVQGDAWASGPLNIPIGKLTPFGLNFSDLAACTISAGLKSAPADTSVPITAAFGATKLVDGAFTVSWDAFPSPAMDLAANATSEQWFLDVQVKHTVGMASKIITTNRYLLRVVWQRDTVT